VESSRSLRIGIQKSGRLTQKTMELLTGIGLRFDEYKDRLLVKARNFDVELLLIRDDDIPEYVQDGVCDLGFVGANTTSEKKANVTVLRNLDYGLCRLAVAVPKDASFTSAVQLNGKRIATSYPVLTANWFAERGLQVKTVEISGSVEIAPSLNVADAICDLVSTGNTLKANGLRELETIFKSECQLIQTNNTIGDEKRQLIGKFLTRIDGRQLAERSRYIMMNAPRAALAEISSILPSLNSPTVLPLANPEMIAVHTVIPESKFWEVMENLKAAGATGIVMLPIETMIV
jgi:ATP phosphoribosyltransferase